MRMKKSIFGDFLVPTVRVGKGSAFLSLQQKKDPDPLAVQERTPSAEVSIVETFS
jgi:hypothetical protein